MSYLIKCPKCGEKTFDSIDGKFWFCINPDCGYVKDYEKNKKLGGKK